MESFRKTSGLRRRVLIVDDDQINREILGNILTEEYEISYAANGKEAYQLLKGREHVYSLVLLDLLMPVMDGYQLLAKLKEDEILKSIPVIVMTSETDAEVVSIKLGASDFITKPYDMPEVIQARCQRIIELSEDKSIIRSAEHDTLTGLYNRDFFFEYIRQIEKFNPGREVDVLVLNIDHFRMINEMHGRQEGDLVLQRLAQILMKEFQDTAGIGCRPEADTFYWYHNHRDGYEKVLKDIQEELTGLSDSTRIHIRAGIYQDTDKSQEIEAWFDRAKLACDRIRGDYTRQLCFYSNDMQERSIYQQRLIEDIDDSIANHDFVVYYQPKFGIRGEEPRLRSAEALIRWKHPELGMISPGDFIPLFESNGLIQKLDNYVWREAARQVRAWKDAYGISIPVSVNVSRIDICDPELEEKLVQIMTDFTLSPDDLMLEITESAYADNARRLVEVIDHLRAMGYKIEMDDFGSGYSSLNMLTTISIDVLKMDMKFVRNMQKDEKSLKLVELILDIAQFLDVPVVAEGVEEESQLMLLKERGCELIQGYYFSKPVPPEEFEAFIREELEKRKEEEA